MSKYDHIRSEGRWASDLAAAQRNYEIALHYYNNLKQSFLTQIFQQIDENNNIDYNALSKQLLEQVYEIAESRGKKMVEEKNIEISDALNKYFNMDKSIVNTVQESLQQIANASRKNDLETEIERFTDRFKSLVSKEKKNEQEKNYINAYSQIMKMLKDKNILSSSELSGAEFGLVRRNLIDMFKEKLVTKEGIGFGSEVIKNQIFSDGVLIGYSRKLGGAYAEEATTNALNNGVKAINDKTSITFQQTEKTGDSTNMYYDILSGTVSGNIYNKFLDKLKQDLDEAGLLNNIISTGEVNMLTEKDIQYGVQSKVGWTRSLFESIKENDKTMDIGEFYSIGERKMLANSLGFLRKYPDYERGWHYSALVLSRLENFFKVVGKFQLGVSSGPNFIWMSDLIAKMHEKKLYLTFYYSRVQAGGEQKTLNFNKRNYPTTGEVAWQSKSYEYREQSAERIKSRKKK